MDLRAGAETALPAGTSGILGHRLLLSRRNTKPCVVASVPCALAVGDAEQADILQKPRSVALGNISTQFVERWKKALLKTARPQVSRYGGRGTVLRVEASRPERGGTPVRTPHYKGTSPRSAGSSQHRGDHQKCRSATSLTSFLGRAISVASFMKDKPSAGTKE